MLFHSVGSREVAEKKAEELRKLGYEVSTRFDGNKFEIHGHVRASRWMMTLDGQGKKSSLKSDETMRAKKNRIFGFGSRLDK